MIVAVRFVKHAATMAMFKPLDRMRAKIGVMYATNAEMCVVRVKTIDKPDAVISAMIAVSAAIGT